MPTVDRLRRESPAASPGRRGDVVSGDAPQPGLMPVPGLMFDGPGMGRSADRPDRAAVLRRTRNGMRASTKKQRYSPYKGTKRQEEIKKQRGESTESKPRDPTRDRFGNRIWSGTRDGVGGWYSSLKKAMDNKPSKQDPTKKAKDEGCALQIKGVCTGGADAIDHRTEWAEVQTTLPVRRVCDGDDHWNAVYLRDARDAYNGGNPEHEPAPKLDNFQWACTACNSYKSGPKNRDISPPVHLGRCPGDTCDCTDPGAVVL